MMLVLEVRTARVDGTTVARTTAALDGSVTMALHPALLDAPELVARHLAEVHVQLQARLRSLRRVEQAITVVGWGAVAATAGSGVMSAKHAWVGAVSDAAWWLAALLLGLLARWLLPTLVRAVMSRSLAGRSPSA